MTLKTACAIGIDCGLTTLGEAVLNIDLYAVNIFNYNEIVKELRELYDEFDAKEMKMPIKENFLNFMNKGKLNVFL